MSNDAEVVRDLVAEFPPFFGYGFSEESDNGLGELFLLGIEAVVCDVGVHDSPQALDWVKVWTIGGQLDQMDAALRA